MRRLFAVASTPGAGYAGRGLGTVPLRQNGHRVSRFREDYGSNVVSLGYLGPGLGAGVTLIVVGVIALVIITVVTFLWFPIKRFFKKRKS